MRRFIGHLQDSPQVMSDLCHPSESHTKVEKSGFEPLGLERTPPWDEGGVFQWQDPERGANLRIPRSLFGHIPVSHHDSEL